MLNIFADALLIATRFGQPTLREDHARRSPREFQDIEGLRVADTLRNQTR